MLYYLTGKLKFQMFIRLFNIFKVLPCQSQLEFKLLFYKYCNHRVSGVPSLAPYPEDSIGTKYFMILSW